MSNFFLKKLQKANHFYIDRTFIFPPDFSQLIVLLYFDENIKKRYPGCFLLINNKSETGYSLLFNNLYNILTIENTKKLNLKSYTTDFEPALVNSLKKIFKGIKHIGCYYHFSRNVYEKMKKFNLLNKDLLDNTLHLYKNILSLPYTFKRDNTLLDSIFNKYGENYKPFKNYFVRQWKNYQFRYLKIYLNTI